MPYGSTNGGTPSGGLGGGLPGNGGLSRAASNGGITTAPTFQKTKAISYGTSDEIFSLISSAAVDAPSISVPSMVELTNNGGLPLIVMVGYKSYSNETTIDDSGATRYIHIMLMPGEVYYPSIRAVISTATATTQFDGTIATNAVPDSNEYTDSGIDTNDDGTPAAGIIGSDTDTTIYMTPFTSSTNNSVNMFRIGDLIRINNEIMEVTAVGSGADADNDYLTVIRGVYGSTAVDTHADATDVRFPFFNAYHDFDRYSVAQTDSSGRFKCTNFFGQGRSATVPQGLIPGSVAIKFYNAGYQELGMSGITSSTNSGLTAGDEYKFDITVDGAGLHNNLAFTIDSSNFGGTNGVISKINAAFDEQYYTAGNLFEERVTVGIVGGDIRFTSGQRLSTSAILLAAPTSGTTPFGVGRFPAIGNIDAAVAARLPDDVLYDRITYATTPNSGAFGYDDGYGRLLGMCQGTINYETGAIDMTGCPVNAEFVYSVAHTSAFSGKLTDASTDRGGALVNILANCPSQKWDGSIQVKVW